MNKLKTTLDTHFKFWIVGMGGLLVAATVPLNRHGHRNRSIREKLMPRVATVANS